MKVRDAVKITGSMTRTSKMPGLSYSLPAWECQVGSKLRAVKGSVCSGCYALKGNYTRYPAIKAAQYYRLQSLRHPQWIPAMVAQIKRQKYFRWHDAGDLQGVWHLKNIMEVCTLTPSTKHWLPTREVKYTSLMDPDIIPSNLIIRMSSHMIDQQPVKFWPWTSTVQSSGAMRSSHVQNSRPCPAQSQGNSCKDCRACWDRSVSNVTYPKH